jgi:hypothetical protein
MKSSELAKYIRILGAEEGNCTVVLDESESRLSIFIDSGFYETSSKNATAKVERKVQKTL